MSKSLRTSWFSTLTSKTRAPAPFELLTPCQTSAKCSRTINAALGTHFHLARLGCVYASAKRRGEARAVLHKLKGLRKRKYVAGYDLAALHAALGENDGAFAWLETALAERDEALGLLGIDPAFDGLRPDPRFAGLLNRLGLPL